MTYATTVCHGFCPVYTVAVSADGASLFTGTSNTAVIGERRFRAAPAQAAKFFNRLQPYLPTGELLLTGPDSCRTYATDLPSVDVRWTGGAGSGHLLYDYGCDRDEHRALAEALRDAPLALPLGGLIGKRRFQGADSAAHHRPLTLDHQPNG
ncbi:DUF6438 domain-containing protein [Sphingomonas sp. S2-65]|uniref:DUF6438 domain-containing protein n=1 Tax=Sphingomonas sp. S2-65 TaxID=2903960 RepID=UPI001F1EE793|nr:DUF6438 domain-containing protein [Sphingomonas sp. S2-65]UYY57186.1 DUF6438 domain-containing protein [Sphingomonas sp. S2-65]